MMQRGVFLYDNKTNGHRFIVFYADRQHGQVIKAFRRHLRNRKVPFYLDDFKVVKRLVRELQAKYPPGRYLE
jgi:hypothetical protein